MACECILLNLLNVSGQVTRIMGAEVDSPYDVLGVNRNMSADNTKKS